jgi:hypothetical protein
MNVFNFKFIQFLNFQEFDLQFDIIMSFEHYFGYLNMKMNYIILIIFQRERHP